MQSVARGLPGGVTSVLEVPIGECALSDSKALVADVAASLVVCLMDQDCRYAGLRHIAFPKKMGHRRDDMLMSADGALEELLNRMMDQVGHDHHFYAKLFGTAVCPDVQSAFDGPTTSHFAKSWFAGKHVPVIAESLGACCVRRVVLLPGSGTVYCRRFPMDAGLLAAEQAALASEHHDAHYIELF